MPTSDPTYTLMLQTPEAREVWEKVLEMRGRREPIKSIEPSSNFGPVRVTDYGGLS